MAAETPKAQDVRAWLRKARKDLRAARHDLTADPPFLGDVAFHCQQAVEKSLKAFLAWHEQRLLKTHSIEQLGRQVLRLAPGLEDSITQARRLTEYAWKFRYPGEIEEPTRQEVDAALSLAQRIYDEVLSLLPPEVSP